MVINFLPPLFPALSILDRKYSPVVAHVVVCRVAERNRVNHLGLRYSPRLCPPDTLLGVGLTPVVHVRLVSSRLLIEIVDAY
jgi:hypothetical protein